MREAGDGADVALVDKLTDADADIEGDSEVEAETADVAEGDTV